MIDTAHFRGNFPESVTVEAASSAHATAEALMGGGVAWHPLLPRSRLSADALHSFARREGKLASLPPTLGPVSHLRLSIFPDGGVMRVRALGTAAAPMPAEPPIETVADDQADDRAEPFRASGQSDGRLPGVHACDRPGMDWPVRPGASSIP